MSDATVVRLGNPSPVVAVTEGGKVVERIKADGPSVTEVHFPAHIVKQLHQAEEHAHEGSHLHLLTSDILSGPETALQHVLHVVGAHALAGVDWVATDDAKLKAILESFLGASGQPPVAGGAVSLEEIRQLATMQERHWEGMSSGIGPGVPTMLKTKLGVDIIANASFGTATQPAALNYVALTANETAPANTDTTLTGEITTAEGGLIRQQATYAHTAETTTATLTVTFTANAKDSLPVTVHKFGVFNKVTSGGTMGIETALTAVTFNAAEDKLTLVETLTIS